MILAATLSTDCRRWLPYSNLDNTSNTSYVFIAGGGSARQALRVSLIDRQCRHRCREGEMISEPTPINSEKVEKVGKECLDLGHNLLQHRVY